MNRGLPRYFLPLLFSILVIGMGPFVEEIRRVLREAMPLRQFVTLVGLTLAGLLAGLLTLALFRIRRQRGLRYGGLGLALGLVGLQILVWDRGNPETNAVERIHFVFYGLLAFLVYRTFPHHRGVRHCVVTLASVALVGTLDEWLQWYVVVRTGDVMDVLLNLYAGLAGLIVSLALDPQSSLSWSRKSSGRAPLPGLLAALVLVFGGFFHCAHLGYEIDDPEIGSFRSFFKPDELALLRQQKGAQWRRNPPLRAPLAQEDYYWTEAGWHVLRRRAAVKESDSFETWKENRILERYFTPFLALRSREGKPFRFSAEERREVARRRPRPDPYPFRSRADQGRIYPRPTKLQFWTGISFLVILCLIAPRLPFRRHSHQKRT